MRIDLLTKNLKCKIIVYLQTFWLLTLTLFMPFVNL